MVSDGADDHEDTSIENVKRLNKELAEAEINLLIIGYTYDAKKIQFLQLLSTATPDSIYVELDKADNLEPFLASFSEPKLGKHLYINMIVIIKYSKLELYLVTESFQ